MRYMNCFEAVLGLLSSLFTADIKSDGAVIAGVALHPVSRAVPEQPSWELGTCTTATELYREGSSWGKLLAENCEVCEMEIVAHTSSTRTKSQPVAALKIHFQDHSGFLCTVKEKKNPGIC